MKRLSTNSLREPSLALATVLGAEPRPLNDLAKELAEMNLSKRRYHQLAELPAESALAVRLQSLKVDSPKLIEGMKQVVLDFSKPVSAVAGRIRARNAKLGRATVNN
jgi:hypothetical protein